MKIFHLNDIDNDLNHEIYSKTMKQLVINFGYEGKFKI